MKNVKKILTLVISGLAVVGFVLCLLSSVLAVLKGGGISIMGVICCLVAAVLEIIGLIKSLKFFISAFRADVTNWSTQKDCIRLIRSVASLLMFSGIMEAVYVVMSFLESVARSSGSKPSDAALERVATNMGTGIGAFVFALIGLIVIAIAVGKKADDKPVRKVALVIGMIFVYAAVATSIGFLWLSSVGLWLFVAMGVATIVYSFFKPVKEEVKEEVAEEPAAEEPVQE